VNGSLAAGSHEIAWDGKDEAGRLVASGTYIYRLVNGSNVQVRRMVLVK
jgi:flagellar hook assembly protein FlgD